MGTVARRCASPATGNRAMPAPQRLHSPWSLHSLGLFVHHFHDARPVCAPRSGSSPEGGDSARPLSGSRAIERIASTLNVPREVVQWEFWNVWDALRADAKFTDYLPVLTEKRVMAVLRRKEMHASRTADSHDRPGHASI
ncbi:DUF3562 domain-containing protein [Cupriavidus yeoncheonensis]|uniref:DUF3562 domain-containing protein n=1 Tax=Cupriavidus yeoncheonensis TaxID=1462994 RepID=UPI003B845C09